MGILIDFSLTVLISLCCIFFHKFIALIYIDDKNILKISSKLIRIVGIYIIFDAMQLQLCGIIRGIGKQFTGMLVGVTIFIFVQTAICIIFVHVLDLGVYGIWFAQMICVFLAMVIYYLIIRFSDWNELAKEISFPDKENENEGRLVKEEEDGNFKFYNSNSLKTSETDESSTGNKILEINKNKVLSNTVNISSLATTGISQEEQTV